MRAPLLEPVRGLLRALGVAVVVGAFPLVGLAQEPPPPRGSPDGAAAVDSAIHMGPLTLEVHRSRTAQVFHVVDQLSAWSPFCHAHYAAALPLSTEDRALLARHAEIRRRSGWNSLERVFYVPDDVDIDAAIARGVEGKTLTKEDGEVERTVLRAFAPRLGERIAEGTPRLLAFQRRLAAESPRLAATTKKLADLCAVKDLPPVPAFLIWNPSKGAIGGGYGGERLTLEVPTARDAMPSFLHEAFHAILRRRLETIARAAATAPGLDEETLNEGIAYAFAPGLVHDRGAGADPLADLVRGDREAGRTLDDPYVRFHRLGLEIRPKLEKALEGGVSFDALLEDAVAGWLRVKAARAPR